MKDSSRYYPGSIDSHAHLSLLQHKELDAAQVLDDANQGGLARIVDVGVRPSDLADRATAFAAYPILTFTAGLHPTAVDPESLEGELATLENELSSGKRPVVAVGEVGMDFYWSNEHRELQIEVFERQCDLAHRFGLPLIVHNRSSEQEMLAAVDRRRPQGVMHCFSQGAEYCTACLDLDLFVSFGGNVTYRRSDEIREAARLVPDDKLLVETDAPYLSPQAVRGTPNHPGHLGFIIGFLAELRGVTPEHIASVTAENAQRLFRISPWREAGA